MHFKDQYVFKIKGYLTEGSVSQRCCFEILWICTRQYKTSTRNQHVSKPQQCQHVGIKLQIIQGQNNY